MARGHSGAVSPLQSSGQRLAGSPDVATQGRLSTIPCCSWPPKIFTCSLSHLKCPWHYSSPSLLLAGGGAEFHDTDNILRHGAALVWILVVTLTLCWQIFSCMTLIFHICKMVITSEPPAEYRWVRKVVNQSAWNTVNTQWMFLSSPLFPPHLTPTSHYLLFLRIELRHQTFQEDISWPFLSYRVLSLIWSHHSVSYPLCSSVPLTSLCRRRLETNYPWYFITVSQAHRHTVGVQ